MDWTRRNVLQTGATLTIGSSLAGCTATTDDVDDDGLTVYGSFFTLSQFVDAVGGEHVTAKNAVPAGEHGHAWEPPSTLLAEIATADGFVYLDADGFQPWAQNVADELHQNYPDVAVIDALNGIDLLEYDPNDHSDNHRHESHGGHEADGSQIDEHAHVDDHTHSHSDTHSHDGEHTHSYGDAHSHEGDHNDSPADAHNHNSEHDHSHDGHHSHNTDHDHSHTHTHGDGQRHDHGHSHSHVDGQYDVKFFSDPLVAKEGVENVRAGLSRLSVGNTPTFTENAAAYTDQLDALHAAYKQALTDRDHDSVVLAGHDSFRYLAERHGFEIHTPVGLSPDETVANTAIAETIDLVERRSIEYVLYDYFDGSRMADVIVDGAETAVEALMVSPAESVAVNWQDNGYGDYVSQLERINLPAFEKALGAD